MYSSSTRAAIADPRSKDMVVALKDIDGNEVFSQRLHAKPCQGWGRDD